MKKLLTFFIITSLILVNISFVMADGAYFPRPGYWIRPGQQNAVIFYEDNTEIMILTSTFQGNAKDLVWIVPTPSKPEITKASEKVFTNIMKLSRARYNSGFDFGYVLTTAKGINEDSGVIVLESKQVDYYEVNIILATNSNDLVKWFNENNYDYPEEYAYVLKSYIDKGWYFTAIKISPESQGAIEVIQDLKEGHPTPIKMTFLSDKIVFPLKISSVEFSLDKGKCSAAKDEPIGATRKDKYGNTWTKVSNSTDEANWRTDTYSYSGTMWGDSLIDQQPCGIHYSYVESRYSSYAPINLYVIAKNKYEADNFYPRYGNWVKKSQIEALGYDEKSNAFITPKDNKYFLTYLSANFQKSQLDEDLILRKSDNNQKVNAGPETWQLFLYGLLIWVILSVIWIFSPIGMLFIMGSLILFLSSNKITKTFGWIMNIISFSITLLIGLILLVTAILNNSLNNYIVISILITCLSILGMMILFIALIKKH
ncbi:DUF2330 domain-containing protein [Candidatus Pacearchaeota archaeon]|nr:DUF2330 domain-containing protein [Candidatus Pacearchaeota archaeon]